MKNNPIKTFSRRLSRSLRDSQTELIDKFLPKIRIDPSSDFAQIRGNYTQICLEIGFGNGDFTTSIALAHPNNLYIGAEPFLNGVASLLRKIQENSISNIRIFHDDVRILLSGIPHNYLDKIFIICPDPWPKKKHHKRRLVQMQLLEELAKHLKIKGKIEIVTDHLDYAGWILDESLKCQSLKIHSRHLEDHRNLDQDWIYTKYQKRGLNLGSNIYYFRLIKE
jgi:tRNA (guanine-N7-)-methyltransferase